MSLSTPFTESVLFDSSVAIFDLLIADGAFFLATEKGLWLSLNDGKTWEDAYHGMFAGVSMPTLCLTQEINSGMIQAGIPGGVLRTMDRGVTWSAVRLQEPAPLPISIASSLDEKHRPALIMATEEDGVFVSDDGGETWASWNFGLLDANLFCLAVSPNYTRNRRVYVGASTGLFRSTNGGYSWAPVDGPHPFETIQAILEIESGRGNILLVGCETGGVFRQCGEGSAWQAAAGIPNLSILRLLAAERPGWVACQVGESLYQSFDYGDSFQLVIEGGIRFVTIHSNRLWTVTTANEILSYDISSLVGAR